MTRLKQALDVALVVGATARLTRLVTTDDLGEWWIRDPAFQVANWHMIRTGELPWWDKYRSGLSCGWCVGYWIGVLVLVTSRTRRGHGACRFTAATLTLNLVTAPIVGKLGAAAHDDNPDDEPAA